MKKKLFCTLCLLAALLHYPHQAARAEAYGSGWYGETQFTLGHEDNISRSYKKEDLVSDNVSSISMGGGHSRKIGASSQLVVSGYVAYSRHDEFNDLDNLATSLELQFIHQPEPGFDSLWYDMSGSVTRLDYRDSDAREGYLFQLDASLNKRLSPLTTGLVGYRYSDLVFLGKSKQAEASGEAFDTMTNEFYLGADLEIVRDTFIYVEYGYLQGGFVSSVSGSPDGSIAYEAESEDPVFETCVRSRCSPRYAYRSDGDIQRADLGLVFPLWKMSFDLSGRYYDAEGNGDTNYRNWYIQLGVVWNLQN